MLHDLCRIEAVYTANSRKAELGQILLTEIVAFDLVTWVKLFITVYLRMPFHNTIYMATHFITCNTDSSIRVSSDFKSAYSRGGQTNVDLSTPSNLFAATYEDKPTQPTCSLPTLTL